MTIANDFSNEQVTAIVNDVREHGLFCFTMPVHPLWGSKPLQVEWCSSNDPQEHLQTILKAINVVASWQERGLEHQINIESLALKVLSQRHIACYASDNEKPNVSIALQSMKGESHYQWKSPFVLVNEIAVIAKKLLLNHISEKESSFNPTTKSLSLNENLENNLKVLEEHLRNSNPMVVEESGKLSIPPQPSMLWQVISYPASFIWSSEEQPTPEEVEKSLLVVYSTLVKMKIEAPSLMKKNNLAVRVLSSKMVKPTVRNETIDNLIEHVRHQAEAILKETLPQHIQENEGFLLLEENTIIGITIQDYM